MVTGSCPCVSENILWEPIKNTSLRFKLKLKVLIYMYVFFIFFYKMIRCHIVYTFEAPHVGPTTGFPR